MKLIILLAAALVAWTVSATYPKEKCFKKVVRCCHKYSACGYVYTETPSSHRCDYKKCDTKCDKYCEDSCKKVPVHACNPAYKQACTEYTDSYGYTQKRCHQANGQNCSTTYKDECKKVCSDKCHDVCHTVKATCSKTKKFKYAKSCASLKCEGMKFEGNHTKPVDVVDTKEIFVSETKAVRKEIAAKAVHKITAAKKAGKVAADYA